MDPGHSRAYACRHCLCLGEEPQTCHDRLARCLSALAGADAAVGFYYHARGVFAGPAAASVCSTTSCTVRPIFAPLLFGAAGMLGMLASLLRRRDK